MTQSFGIFEDSFDGNVMLLYYKYLRWVILLPVVTSKFRHKMKAEDDRWYRSSLPMLSTRTLGVYPTKKKGCVFFNFVFMHWIAICFVQANYHVFTNFMYLLMCGELLDLWRVVRLLQKQSIICIL